MTRGTDPKSLGDTLFSGTLWMFGMRWFTRLLTVVNVVVVARLLDKEDYGIVAMAAAVVAIPMVFLEFGVDQAIIQKHKPEECVYNTAWTFKVIQMTLVALIIYWSAPLVSEFYGDKRLENILPVLSLSIFLLGLENIWVVSFRKNMVFYKDFFYEVSVRLFSVACSIYLVYYYNSYWGLIYGQVAASLIRLVFSVLMGPRLPRFTISHGQEIWLFSRWTLFRSVASYIVLHSDKLILGRLGTTAEVGAYSMGRDIADLPITEISVPANRSLGPGFAEMQNDGPRLAAALEKALGAIATISLPAAIGLALVAEDLVYVILGEEWVESVDIIQILAVSGAFFTLRNVLGNALVVTGHYIRYSIIVWFRAIVFLPVAILGSLHSGGTGMATAFICSEMLAMFVTVRSYGKILPEISYSTFVKALWRPLTSVLLMSVVVVWIKFRWFPPDQVRFALELIAGATSYVSCVYLLWRIAGKPDGIERLVMERAKLMRRFT